MSVKTQDIRRLFEEFPRNAISWRAQSLTRDGTKAMALAYIDARDVMNRLDEVVGPENWQRSYTHADKKTICSIGIKIDGEWVWKSDGAGDSDIEAEKGAISDAFKRAAVNWGVARYLYEMPSPWVPCEVSEHNGKKSWKSWTQDPWDFVKRKPAPAPAHVQKEPANDAPKKISAAEKKIILEQVKEDLVDATTVERARAVFKVWREIARRDGWPEDCWQAAADLINAKAQELKAQDETVSSIQDEFPGSRVVNETHHPLMAGE